MRRRRRLPQVLRVLLKRRIIRTLILYGVSFTIGYILSLLGVTLLDLQSAVGATFDEAALLYTYMYLGRIAGAVVVTRLLDPSVNRLTTEQSMALSMGVMAASTAAIPWCDVYALMAAAVTVQGVACGYTAVACNVGCFRLWGPRTAPVLQGMALAFSVGLSMAPVVAAPFICNNPKDMIYDSDNRTTENGTASIQPELSHGRVTMTPCCSNRSIFPGNASGMSRFSTDPSGNDYVLSTTTDDDPFSNYTSLSSEPSPAACAFHWPYTIIAIVAVVFTIILLCMSTRDTSCSGFAGSAPQTPTPDRTKHPGSTTPSSRPLRRTVPLLALFGLLYLCLASVETTFGGLILSFCVHQLAMTKSSASVVTLVYWAANMASRIPVIVASRRLSPSAFLGTNTGIICVSVSILAVAGSLTAATGHRAVLWVGSAGLGIGCATAFTNGLTLADQCTPISSQFMSLLIACHSVGCMTGPAVAGLLFRRWGPVWFLYYLTWWALMMLVIFVAIQVYRRRVLRNDLKLHGDAVSRTSRDEELSTQLNEALITERRDQDIVTANDSRYPTKNEVDKN